MAGHLEVSKLENTHLSMRVSSFLSLHKIEEMKEFQQVINNNTSFRKLNSEYFLDSCFARPTSIILIINIISI